MRPAFSLLLLLLMVSLPTTLLKSAKISGTSLPDSLQRFDNDYRLHGCGLRELLFSDIYLLGLYLNQPDTGSDNLIDSRRPRIFLLKVLYKGDLPEDIPDLWKEPLAEQLSREYLGILQDLYDEVDNGDTVEFFFHPENGEILKINGEVHVRKSTVALVPALTELWLGEDPVSDNLKRLLTNRDCR